MAAIITDILCKSVLAVESQPDYTANLFSYSIGTAMFGEPIATHLPLQNYQRANFMTKVNQSPLQLLHTRRSVKAADLHAPGPNPAQIEQLLAAAHRVPDHGKIGPWRFIVFTDEARIQFDNKLKSIYEQNNPDASETLIAHNSRLLSRAPCVIAVIASPNLEHPKVPQWEQTLSAGAACQNLLIAAHALGFSAQWLSEWYSYDAAVNTLLNMQSNEQIAGFIYIGTPSQPPQERARPALDERVTYWNNNEDLV